MSGLFFLTIKILCLIKCHIAIGMLKLTGSFLTATQTEMEIELQFI